MIEAELPDGTILEFPEGTSPDVVQRVVKQRLGVAQQPEQRSQLAALAGSVGQGVGNVALGAQNLLGMGLEKLGAESAGQWLQQDATQGKAKLAGEIAPYAEQYPMTTAGGKLAGEIAATLPVGGVLAKVASKIPGVSQSLVNSLRSSGFTTGGAGGMGARIAGGAATGGASAALVDQDQAAQGALIGGAFPLATAGAGRVGSAIGRALRPSSEISDIAKKAQQYGIPIGVGDLSENRMVQATRSILRDAPFTGGMASGAMDAKQEAFNKAVGSTFGTDAPKLTTDVIDSAKKRMGSEFDRIWNNNNLIVNPELMARMDELQKISAKLPRNEGGSLKAEIDDLVSKMVAGPNGEMVIPGDVANKFQSYLRRRAEGSAGLRNELGDLRQGIITAFNQSVSPTDAAALTLNRSQYKAFKTVEPLLKSAELGVAGRMPGDVPAALLPGAVSRGYSTPTGQLADLAQVGSRFLVDRTPQTGGSARAALQNTAIGAALTGGFAVNPMVTAATIPMAIGVQGALNSPRLAQRLLNPSQPSQALLNALRAAQVSAPVVSAQ